MLIVSGFLIFAAGLTLFIINETSSRGLILGDDYACSTADKEHKKLEQLVKEYTAAKGTPDELKLEVEVNNQIKNATSWSETCADGKSWARFRFTVFLSLTVIGLFLLVSGFFIGRKKTTA